MSKNKLPEKDPIRVDNIKTGVGYRLGVFLSDKNSCVEIVEFEAL